jgi:cytochrome oxidase Cu insertion factor (SCO1/SenC/PrrC family)
MKTVVSTEPPAPVPGKGRARLGIILVFLAFFGPLGLAVWLYFGGWQPSGTVNHGELVLPPGNVSEIGLRTPAGTALSEVSLTGLWSMIVVASGACMEACETDLYNTRQVRLALGKDRGRVQRILLLDSDGATSGDSLWTEQHPDLIVAALPAFELLAQPGYILLIDPLGNMMMRYAPGYASKGMLEDLKRLLKLSEIG